MLTPYLEKKIWAGEAIFKTFTAGGTEKHILPVSNDSWIILLNMIYEPRLPGAAIDDGVNWVNNRLTQLNVFSASRFDSFIFREEFNYNPNGPASDRYGFTGTPFHVPLYCPHNFDVSFTFSQGQNLTPAAAQISSPLTTSKPLPLDYGNAADPGALPVIVETESAANVNVYPGGKPIRRQPNEPGFAQLQFPVSAALQLQSPSQRQSMPLLLVQYVEIFGEMPKTIKPA